MDIRKIEEVDLKLLNMRTDEGYDDVAIQQV